MWSINSVIALCYKHCLFAVISKWPCVLRDARIFICGLAGGKAKISDHMQPYSTEIREATRTCRRNRIWNDA